jgi:hypothetical protein
MSVKMLKYLLWLYYLPLLSLQQIILWRGFDYMRENKCEQIFAEREKFIHTRSAKYAVVAYKKIPVLFTKLKTVRYDGIRCLTLY